MLDKLLAGIDRSARFGYRPCSGNIFSHNCQRVDSPMTSTATRITIMNIESRGQLIGIHFPESSMRILLSWGSLPRSCVHIAERFIPDKKQFLITAPRIGVLEDCSLLSIPCLALIVARATSARGAVLPPVVQPPCSFRVTMSVHAGPKELGREAHRHEQAI